MEDKQTRKYNMGLLSLSEIDHHNAVWSSNTNATTRRDQLETILDNIEQADTDQQVNSGTGPGTTKEEAKHHMAELTEIIAQDICAYALDTNDHDLYQLMNKSVSAIERMKDVQCKDFCIVVRNFAQTTGAALLPYNVTPQMITALTNAITTFETAEPAPMNAVVHHKTATTNVSLSLAQMLNTLHWWDHFVAGLKISNPDFNSDYTGARKVVDTGVRHISIRGLVKDSVNNTPIFHAKVTIITVGQSGSALSGRTGKFNLFSLTPGVYTIKVECPGYITQTIGNISVLDKQLTDINVSLVAA